MRIKDNKNLKLGIIVALGGIFFASVGIFLVLMWSMLNLPKLDNMQDYRPALGSVVLARDGRVLGEYYDTERRYVKNMDEIPEWVANAFVSGEDSNFYEHPGVDYSGILRAFFANLRAGRVVQGGSTITQQVAKSMLLTSERSFTRKIREVMLAYKIEKNFSKKQILSLYLNQIYFGQRAYGVEAASRAYFHKGVKDVTIAEAALLAGLVQAPSKYSPSKNPHRARERQVYVLRRMFDTGRITEADHQKALVENIAIYPEENPNSIVAPYYLEHVRQIVMEKYGADAVYRGGLTIEVAADFDLSLVASRAVRSNLEELDKRQGFRGPLGHVATQDALAQELKKIRSEVISKKIRHQFLPTALADKYTDDSWWEYTLGQVSKLDSTLADERRLLLPNELYRAVVTKIDPDGKNASLMIGSAIKAKLPISAMRWAKRIKPPEISYGAQIVKTSEALKVGDIVNVKVSFPISEKADEPVSVALEQEPLAQSALLSMESSTGHVIAMIGGYSFDSSEYNRALQGERQPGSSFKPTLYAAALDKGFTPSSIIVDSPLIFENQGGSNLKWVPENNSEKFYGDTTLRTAVINSRNIPAVKILQEVGVGNFVNYLKALGLHTNLSPDLSLALGSTTISLLELTKIYALFPRLGMRIEPVFILKVTDRDGKVLEQYSYKEFMREQSAKWLKMRDGSGAQENNSTTTDTSVATEVADSSVKEENPQSDESGFPPAFDDPMRAMDERTAFVMNYLLQEVVQYGTGTGAKVLKRKVGGKTGTTNEFVDAWFMGFSPELVTGVWTGFDNPRTLGKGEVGSRAALPAWIEYMGAALEKYKQDEYQVPKGIVFVRVDPKTGALAGSGSNSGVKEAFIEGTEPSLERQNQKTPDSSDFFREDL